jgi:EmrB/QacA subfamily drug resistance transporter
MERTTQNILLAVATLSGFVATFIASAINMALPLIESEFHLSAVVLDWIPLAYVLAAGAVIMPVGRLADIFGRMRVFLVGLVAFTVLTFASAFAPSAAALLTIRVLHGLAAALLFATNIALVTLSSPPETRGRSLGILTAGVYLGSTAGPVLGGVIVQDLGWRGLFLVIGAVTLVTCALALWKLWGVDWREPKRAPFDVFGSAVWAVAFPALLMGFTFLPGLAGALLVGGGVLGLAFFLWWEARAADPVLSVDLLRHNRVFAFSNLASLINYSATFAMTFLMSLYLQYNLGLEPRQAGLVLVCGTLLQAAVSPIAGRLADRSQPRLVAAAGMVLCVLGLLAFAFLGENTPYWYIILALCALGIGFGLFSSPVAHIIMGSVDKRQVGTASATLATVRMAGQSLSMGIAGLVLAVVVGRHEIGPADYPHLLTSVRTIFAIFTALCALGLAAVLVGPPRRPTDSDRPAQAG